MDVILTAFSCSTACPCGEWAKAYFANTPKVVWVPGANSQQFELTGRSAAKDLRTWVSNLGRIRPEEVERIAVVSFSAGWGFVHQVLASKDVELIDTVIVLDGIHTAELGHEIDYATKAACQEESTNPPTMILAHSQIVPPYISTKTTNSQIFNKAASNSPLERDLKIAPLYVSEAILPKPISLGNQYGKATYEHDPLVETETIGNLWRLEYEGNNAAIHMYVAQYVQPRLWKWLGSRWS